jgi:hypothetical protein
MEDLARRLPARPLQCVLWHKKSSQRLSWEQMAVRLGVCARTLYRLMAATEVSYVVADRMACRLGFHPILLWPKEW